MNEFKILAVLAGTFEQIIFYAYGEDEDDALQNGMKENGYTDDDIIIIEVIKIS